MRWPRRRPAARLGNTGQACNAAKRFIVKDEYYDDFLAKLREQMEAAKPGDPSADGTAVGPLSSKTAADRLEDQVKRRSTARRGRTRWQS